MEDLRAFAKRISKDIRCYTKENRSIITLTKNPSSHPKLMKAFAFIHERKKKQPSFWIAALKSLANEKAIQDADEVKENLIFTQCGLVYRIERDSSGGDYQKAVRSLKSILRARSVSE